MSNDSFFLIKRVKWLYYIRMTILCKGIAGAITVHRV